MYYEMMIESNIKYEEKVFKTSKIGAYIFFILSILNGFMVYMNPTLFQCILFGIVITNFSWLLITIISSKERLIFSKNVLFFFKNKELNNIIPIIFNKIYP